MALKYQIGLCSVWWSASGIDNRFFATADLQEEYFNNKIEYWSDLVNFNIGNNIDTTIIYTDRTTRNIDDLLQMNYCVIKRTDDSSTSYRYFFVVSAKQDCGRQIILQLTLDDIQTNYFKYKNDIKPCKINRAHLNRFIPVENNPNLVTFDLRKSSDLYIEEDFPDLPKRISSADNIVFGQKLNITEIKDFYTWLNEHVICWCYIYVSAAEQFTWYDESGNITQHTALKLNYYKDSTNIYKSDYGVLCYPVMQSGYSIVNEVNAYTYNLDSNSLSYFRTHNNNASHLFSVKYSNVIPFENVTASEFEIQNNVLKLKMSNSLNRNLMMYRTSDNNDSIVRYALLNIVSKGNYFSEDTSIEYNFGQVTFNKSNFTSLSLLRDKKYNPKLLGSKFRNITLSDNSGNSFSYDVMKVIGSTKGSVHFKYVEQLTPDITKFYCGIEFEDDINFIYNSQSFKDMFGLVGSVDNSLSLVNDSLQAVLANQKNFYNTIQLGYKQMIMNTYVKAFSAAGSGNVLGGLSTAVSAIPEMYFKEKQNMYTEDNMKAAPDQVAAAGGNVLFSNIIKDMGIHLERQTALDSDLKTVDDYMFTNGYAYGKIGLISDFDNIRKYFNYVSADVDVISANISNLEKNRLKQKLQGIRFWNSDDVNYLKENYERWLENE